MLVAVVSVLLAFAPAVRSGALPEVLPAVTKNIEKIVAFGDSLTDTGVVAEFTKSNGPQIPSNAYSEGRFTNGKVWLEYLVEAKGLQMANFAAGGATTSDKLIQGWVGGKFGEPLRDDGSKQNVPGVDTQVTSYLKNQDSNKRKILYTIFVGANDNFDNNLLGLNKDGSYYAAAQYDIWNKLADAGATQILVLVLPKLLDADQLQAALSKLLDADKIMSAIQNMRDSLPALLRSQAPAFFTTYGSKIDTMIARFNLERLSVGKSLVKIAKYEVDFTAFLPSSYGLDSIGGPDYCCKDCFSGLPTATVCSTPEKYLLWDGLHPTTMVHQFIADDIAKFIQINFGF
ncbi:GDSL lipase/esterase [Cladochytrium replicatum]|nr:GDSL lipase/esterase [Cladochytrium replicatum]